MTIALSSGEINNGWVVVLNSLISQFNVNNPSNQVVQLTAAELNNGWLFATQSVVDRFNVALTAANKSLLPLLTNGQIDNGKNVVFNVLVYNLNNTQPLSPYVLQNATYVDNVLHYTGGNIVVSGQSLNGYYLQYNTPPENETFTFSIPQYDGAPSNVVVVLSSVAIEDIGVSDGVSVSAATLSSGSSLDIQGFSGSVPSVASGDTIKVVRVGSALEAYVNTALVGSTQTATGTISHMYLATEGFSGQVPNVALTVS